MIFLTTGVPGSGKTYRLVSKVYDLINKKDKKYKHIFTNINGLDLKKINDIAGISNYVQHFEFPDLLKHMQKEYELHNQSKNITDDFLPPIIPTLPGYVDLDSLSDSSKKEFNSKMTAYKSDLKIYDDKKSLFNNLKNDYDNYLKSLKVFELYSGSLIIIDESHLYFEDRADPVLIRFLSYHRHFDIDLDFVTQNKNLINKKYLSFVETMYCALPSSKRFFSSSFRYRHYASYQEYHSNISGSSSLKLNKKVFELYNSGSNVLGNSIIKKLLFPIISLLFLVILGFYLLQSYLFPNHSNLPKKTIKYDSNISKVIVDKSSVIDDSTKKYYVLTCFAKSCKFSHSSFSFDKINILSVMDKFKCDTTFTDTIDSNFVMYVLNCNSSLSNVLNLFKNKKILGVSKNEKNNMSLFNRSTR